MKFIQFQIFKYIGLISNFVIIILFVSTSHSQELFLKDSNKKPGGSPNSSEGEFEIHYDGDNWNGVGAPNLNFIIAARFTTTQTIGYIGSPISEVRVYIRDPVVDDTATVIIYSEGTEINPGSEIHRQGFTPAANSWNEITLVAPVIIPDGDIWVGVQAISGPSGSQWWAGIDAGPNHPDGQWIFDNGIWQKLASLNPSLTYNWNIRAVVGEIVGPGIATDPDPANGESGVEPNGLVLSWTNPLNTETNEVFFGDDPGNLTLIYSGNVIDSINAPQPLLNSTIYYWKVNETDTSGTTIGQTWSFTTASTAVQKFYDAFDANIDSLPFGWTVVNDGGTGIWGIYPNSTQPIWPNAYSLPCGTGCGKVLAADSDHWGSGSTLLSTATINQTIDATLCLTVWLEFDNDFYHLDNDDQSFVEVSTDGGTNWTIIWSVIGTSKRNTHEIVDISSLVSEETFQVRFRSVQPGWDLWWAVDNVAIYVENCIIPVELSSFSATVANDKVNLNWSTATETNNYGFEIERKNPPLNPLQGGEIGEWEKIGFVAGYGTTTENKSYTFNDENLTAGVYQYRLKQIDFDGTFEYSEVVEVEVGFIPDEFVLFQNYPNPFNPSTVISWQSPVSSRQTIKIFDVLGNEVATLVDEMREAGTYEVEFDASYLSSGIYFYKLTAGKFSSIKKMVVIK